MKIYFTKKKTEQNKTKQNKRTKKKKKKGKFPTARFEPATIDVQSHLLTTTENTSTYDNVLCLSSENFA